MAAMENQTFFAYHEGYDSNVLRLGNLVFDFANPRQQSPYIHAELDDTAVWATADERPICYLAAQDGRNCSFGLGLNDLLSFDTSRSRDEYHLIVGTNGSKVELKNPVKFFTEAVLTSDEARFWLESRLAIVQKLELLEKKLGPRPRIWLLTGLYEICDASFLSVSKRASELGVTAAIPIPEPTSLTTLLGLTVGGKAQISSGATVTAGGKILGKRVWAAQWQRIDAKYMSVEKWNRGDRSNQLKLLPIISLQAKAGPLDKIEVAEVTLVDSDNLDEEEPGQLDEDYWKLFNEEIKDIEEEMAGDSGDDVGS